MTATAQVIQICKQIGSHLHPHSGVSETDWEQWLGAFGGLPEKLGDCPQCGMGLTRRTARKSKRQFIGCTGWKKGGSGCSYTRSAS